MGTELNTYQVRTNDRAQDLEALKDLTKKLGYVVTVAKPVVGKLKKADENADKASQGLDKTELALGVRLSASLVRIYRIAECKSGPATT